MRKSIPEVQKRRRGKLSLRKILCYGRVIVFTSDSMPSALALTPHASAPLPVVAIIGRPNVGKSTLFNRILGKKTAIVDDVPGVTRDRNYADANYRNRPFRLVDTGGLDPSASEGMLALIKRQSELAIAEADILILLMDGRTGLMPQDQEVVRLLRGTTKPLFVAVNKIDTPKVETMVADFYQLGIEQLYPISAEHGMGVAELLDAVYPHLLPLDEQQELHMPRVAVVGRPNVGKSTLVNAVLGEDRVVVSDVPGTTRDSIDSLAVFEGRRYLFTDTAGIRRRGKIDRGIEGYSVARSLRAIGRSDVAVLLLDAEEGVTEQDTKIAGVVIRQGRACLLMVNKWDLREGDAKAKQQYEKELRRRFPFLSWAPVLFASAIKPDSLRRLFPTIDEVFASFSKRIPTGELNEWLQKILATHPLPVRKGKPTKITKSAFITQVAVQPPVFALFVGHPQDMTVAYIRFLENQLRETYGFSGAPIRLLIRKK
jgi:GTP-binding protein